MSLKGKMKNNAAAIALVMALACAGVCAGECSIASAKTHSITDDIARKGADAGAHFSRAEYATDQVLVSFDAETSGKNIKRILNENDSSPEDQIKMGDEKIVLAGIDEEASVGKVLSDLDGESKVNYVQPNYIYKAAGEADPFLNKNSSKYQYNFDMLHIKEAWSGLGAAGSKVSAQESGRKIKIAVLDSGVDIYHEDLKANVSSYKKVEDGKVTDATDDTGTHGTHVTGIIAASYNNGRGGAGIAAGENNELTETAVYGISPDGENMFSYDIITGINAAVDDGARIINMSFGGYGKDRLMVAAIRKAYYEKGIAFVAAAGNEATDEFMEPSDISEVISVCACGENGAMMNGTNYGRSKDITAPGSGIVSTVPGNLYNRSSGTSMSAPAVTGVCGLMLCASPDLDPAQLRNIICATAVTDPEGLSEKYYQKNNLGYGRIDPPAAVNAAKQAKTTAVNSIEIKKEKNDDTITVYTDNIDKNIFGDEDSDYIIRGTCLEALIKPANSSAKITWSSDDESIAKVDEHGYVTGFRAGESTTIRAKAGGKTDQVKVRVKSSIDPKSVSLKIKDSEKVMYTGEISGKLSECVSILPADAEKEMYWFSSDKDVLAVDEDGWLTAKKAGHATITVRTYNGHEAKCEMMVIETPAKIEIYGGTDWMTVGQSRAFSAAVKDDKGNILKNENVTFSSGNNMIASVDKGGKVTAKKDGNFYLFAETDVPKMTEEDDGKLIAYKKITVTKKSYKGKDYGLKKKKTGKHFAALKWNTIPKASGYELERAGKKNGKYKLIKKLPASSKTYKNKGLKKGRKYYYRIRATYVKDGKAGKYSYSLKVRVKTKK